MKPAQKRTLYKASAFSALFAVFAAVLYLSSRVTAPDLVPVAAFGAGFISASAAFWMVLRKRDLMSVIEALDRASIGDFSYRIISHKGVPENLAEAYNRMAKRAEKRFAAMQGQIDALLSGGSQGGYRERCAELEKMLAEADGKQKGSTITDLDAERRLRADPMTGLFNKRQMEQAMLRELKSSQRFGRKMSAVIADLDSFRDYNKNHGARAGEKLLKGVASTLKNCVREVDTVARSGDDEFTIILAETSPGNAVAAAERIRLAVMASGPLTVSIGVATYPEDASDLDGLLGKAEAALETSKKEGRNRTTASGPLPGSSAWARAA